MRHSIRVSSLRAPIAAASVMLALLSGCGDGDRDVDMALAVARGQLEALQSTRLVSVPAQTREQVYETVVAKLGPIASTTDGPAGSTAKLLLAEAIAGQATLASEDHRELGVELLRLLTAAESKLDLYTGQHSLAEALSGYDPTEDIAQLDRLASERTTEHTELSQDVAQREAEIQALLDEAQQIKLLAEEKRRQVGALRTQALDADPALRATLIADVHVVRRERERLFVDVEGLESQAARLEPDLATARLELQRVDLQLQQLSAARERTNAEATALSNESGEARRDASDTAQDAVRTLDQLIAMFEGDFAQSFRDCSGQYDRALGHAQQARRDGSVAAVRAVSSMIELAHASIQREQSESLGRIARLMERAGAMNPTLPRSDEWTAKAQALGDEATSVFERASIAYQSVADTVRQTGRGGDPDSAERVAVRLESLGGISAPSDEGEEAPLEGSDEAVPAAEDGNAPADELPAGAGGDVAP